MKEFLRKVEKQIAALKWLQNVDFDTLIQNSVQNNKEEIILLAQHQIYQDHENIYGQKLYRKGESQSYIYSDRYALKKRKLGRLQSGVDLSLTGDFLDSFHIEFFPTYIVIRAGDIEVGTNTKYNLTEILRDYYGQNGSFEGLTKENLKIISKVITKEVGIELRKQFLSKLN